MIQSRINKNRLFNQIYNNLTLIDTIKKKILEKIDVKQFQLKIIQRMVKYQGKTGTNIQVSKPIKNKLKRRKNYKNIHFNIIFSPLAVLLVYLSCTKT